MKGDEKVKKETCVEILKAYCEPCKIIICDMKAFEIQTGPA